MNVTTSQCLVVASEKSFMVSGVFSLNPFSRITRMVNSLQCRQRIQKIPCPTCSEYLESVLPPSLHMWAQSKYFLQSNVLINMISSSEFKTVMVRQMSEYVNFENGDHFIIYSNPKVCTSELRKKMQGVFREMEMRGYIVLPMGGSFAEEKQYATVVLGDPSLSSLRLLGIH
uniref:Uncharacterized protein n=1 Tax=Corethron hystrix TaxID=216773 RepID=A0A7S1FNV6_9STRA|mmetsp:Transcript_17074/g.38415  ORF Transcript_17074/g.38415 Transcript_17074/m.38415 type:complete len:172 (+) Transcript_17074:569-1084(+)